MKKRTAFFLSLLPLMILLLVSKKKKVAAVLAMTGGFLSIIRARKGRSKEVEKYLPGKTVFYAPLWILERSISIYLALYWRKTRGGYPFGDKVVEKGTGRAWTEGKQPENLHRDPFHNAAEVKLEEARIKE